MTHTPGPWRVGDAGHTVFGPPNGAPSPKTIAPNLSHADARLIAAAPDLLAALKNVRELIVEAAMTGFDYKNGNWPQRLFASQQVSSKAIAKAEGKL